MLVLWKFAIYRKASKFTQVFAVLVLVFVVYNRRREAQIKYPGPDDDVRENIINYEDEGGGEDDMTAFDITPLQVEAQLDRSHFFLFHTSGKYQPPPCGGTKKTILNSCLSDPHRGPVFSPSKFTTAKNTL